MGRRSASTGGKLTWYLDDILVLKRFTRPLTGQSGLVMIYDDLPWVTSPTYLVTPKDRPKIEGVRHPAG